MNQKYQRLIYALAGFAVIALAGASASVRADDDSSDYSSNYDCIGNICVGTTVNVIGGQWVGHAGAVVGIDLYNDTVTVINSSGYYLYPYVRDVRSIYGDTPQSNCTRNVCLGDQVRVIYGQYSGYTGQVVGTNSYTLQATILLQGRYIIVNIRDLSVLSQQPRPMPYPRPVPRACPIGYVYDYYRGCVRITGSYPVPPRRRYPAPYPAPRPYPAPGHYPTPPRRVETPRYPTPGPRTGQYPRQRPGQGTRPAGSQQPGHRR